MKSTVSYLASGGLVVALLLGGASGADAAVISFSSQAFTNANQISTHGTLVQAVNLGQGNDSGGVNSGVATTPVTVNGVTFGADSGDGVGFFVVDAGGAVAPGTFKANDGNDFRSSTVIYNSAVNPIAGMSVADSEDLLQSVEFGGGVGNSVARLSGLTVGQEYQLQILLARTQGETFSVGYATPSGDATEILPFNRCRERSSKYRDRCVCCR